MAAMICWRIWEQHNAKLWRKPCILVDQVSVSALSLLCQWEQAIMSNSRNMSHTPTNRKKWEPPKHGFLKCNFDAAIAKQNQRIVFNYIIRNEKGELIGAKNGHKRGFDNVLEAESLSCQEALLWIKDKGLANIIFKSDSQLLVRVINMPIFYSSTVGLILQDCMYLLNNLNGCAITFANRSTNQAAHKLAKVVVS